MSIQFAELAKIAGVTMLLTILWAASVAFAFWDVQHRHLAGGKVAVRLAMVMLLPFIGFLAYLVFRTFTPRSSSRSDESDLRLKRVTALKPFPPKRSALPTLIASELDIQSIRDTTGADQPYAEQRKASPKFVFTVLSGADQAKEFIVDRFPAKIGRGSEISIPLDGDLGVSRTHAEINERGGLLKIRDLKSTHGTQVNNASIEEHDLEPGDRIQVGSTVLVFTMIYDQGICNGA